MVRLDDDDETVVLGKNDAELDDRTVATRRRRADIGDTVIVGRAELPDDSTRASKRARGSRGQTAASEPVAEQTLASDTVASLGGRGDRTRKITRPRSHAAPTTPGVPGVLTQGRVASTPGKHVDRYPVRVAEPPPLALVRHVVLPPVVEERRNRDASAIAEATIKKRASQAVTLLAAVTVVTVVSVLVVVAAVVLLSAP